MSFTLNKYECYRCEREYEAYDFGALCPECEELMESLKCGGCVFLRDEGYDYTYCELYKCDKYNISYSDIEFCKKYKITER